MFVWDQHNGVNDYTIHNWVPYVYIPKDGGDTKTIDGVSVRKREFNSYQEYSDYQKGSTNIYENMVPKEIQYLTEAYHGIPDDEIEVPDLKIYSIDIEVHSERGFPKPQQALHPVVLINVREFGGGANKTWGIKPYTGENSEDIDYVWCPNEMELLKRFFAWWHENAPDVVTGWNIAPNNKMNKRGGFDFPYLVNRTKNLFGKKADLYKKLSPINIVRCWEDQESGAMYVDIAGVSVIDYFALYKWYSPKNPENYKLDTISRLELDLGKLDYSQYQDLRTLFHENWNMYVDYNAVDNKRIDQLEDELGYIRLAQNLALLCRCKMESYTSATQLVEGLMLTHYRRNNLCAPYLAGGQQEWFPAAFVKQPQIGQYDWVVDLDIASSYPTAIITLNMSPETYYGRIIAYKNTSDRWVDIISGRDELDITQVANMETPITEMVRAREFPEIRLMRDSGISTLDGARLDKFNKAIKRGLLCVAPCGSIFVANKKGHFAQVEQETFAKRVVVKNKMKEARLQARNTDDEALKAKLETKATNFFALQWALKIVLNSAYGVTGVPYSRYFNINVSEAVTSCGRRAIVDGQKYVNRWFQNKEWTSPEVLEILGRLGEVNVRDISYDEDFVAYIDTDSVFIKLGHFIDTIVTRSDGSDWKDAVEEDDIITAILELSKIVEDYVNECAYHETQVGAYNSRMSKEEFSITFKQEIVCKSALFITKKKYGYHVVNEEHVPCDKIDVTGLEIIRSETPSAFRDALRDMLGMILRNASNEDILKSYREYKKVARSAYPEEISENKGITGLDKYIINGKPIKGTPYHVKAAANYHHMLRELDLEDKYPEIEDGSKNKLVYVKPNPYGIKNIMYDRYPPEFLEAGIVPDYGKQIDKFLTNKLKMLLEPMKREHILEQNQAFSAFFGV